MLNKDLLKRIEMRFGRPIRYPEETVALSQAIFDTTHEYLSPSTLKRMFGWLSGGARHRSSTMDILARYLGYAGYAELQRYRAEIDSERALMDSEYSGCGTIVIGCEDKIVFTSSRGESLSLIYKGERLFSVVSSTVSDILPGDSLRLHP
jgi:hypothetical protein